MTLNFAALRIRSSVPRYWLRHGADGGVILLGLLLAVFCFQRAPVPVGNWSVRFDSAASELAPVPPRGSMVSPAPIISPVPEVIGYLIRHPEARPRQVTLLVPTEFELFALGAKKGQIQAARGTEVVLLNVGPNFVDVTFGGATKRLPITATDLAALAPLAIRAYEARAEARKALVEPGRDDSRGIEISRPLLTTTRPLTFTP